MERLATRERGVHLRTLEDRDVEVLQGDDVIVLDVIRITDDQVLNGTPPRSTHVRDGRRLLLLDPAR